MRGLLIYYKKITGGLKLVFHLEHHLAGGKAAKGFMPDRTQVFTSTISSHRVIME